MADVTFGDLVFQRIREGELCRDGVELMTRGRSTLPVRLYQVLSSCVLSRVGTEEEQKLVSSMLIEVFTATLSLSRHGRQGVLSDTKWAERVTVLKNYAGEAALYFNILAPGVNDFVRRFLGDKLDKPDRPLEPAVLQNLQRLTLHKAACFLRDCFSAFCRADILCTHEIRADRREGRPCLLYLEEMIRTGTAVPLPGFSELTAGELYIFHQLLNELKVEMGELGLSAGEEAERFRTVFAERYSPLLTEILVYDAAGNVVGVDERVLEEHIDDISDMGAWFNSYLEYATDRYETCFGKLSLFGGMLHRMLSEGSAWFKAALSETMSRRGLLNRLMVEMRVYVEGNRAAMEAGMPGFEELGIREPRATTYISYMRRLVDMAEQMRFAAIPNFSEALAWYRQGVSAEARVEEVSAEGKEAEDESPVSSPVVAAGAGEVEEECDPIPLSSEMWSPRVELSTPLTRAAFEDAMRHFEQVLLLFETFTSPLDVISLVSSSTLALEQMLRLVQHSHGKRLEGISHGLERLSVALDLDCSCLSRGTWETLRLAERGDLYARAPSLRVDAPSIREGSAEALLVAALQGDAELEGKMRVYVSRIIGAFLELQTFVKGYVPEKEVQERHEIIDKNLTRRELPCDVTEVSAALGELATVIPRFGNPTVSSDPHLKNLHLQIDRLRHEWGRSEAQIELKLTQTQIISQIVLESATRFVAYQSRLVIPLRSHDMAEPLSRLGIEMTAEERELALNGAKSLVDARYTTRKKGRHRRGRKSRSVKVAGDAGIARGADLAARVKEQEMRLMTTCSLVRKLSEKGAAVPAGK
ncbi:MAG: hypothetical protein SP1CHLAM54_01740 [Chlamydiia bacterium]|nr:hypothetical protein [Chlamydiia bacterium]MCH9615092.1 hypothetical protein [Chlamydiia bacterium]MCH9628586.1 hypothetical protein [Chlamydiia bacterium]